MPFSLYDAIVPSWLQILGAATGLLDKAEAHCAAGGLAPADIIAARLADDMLPFAYQVKSTRVHSVGAIEGVRRGSFAPDMTTPPESFDALKAQVADSIAALEAIDPAEVDALVGRPMLFAVGDYRMDYTAENFLLSFSQPNFYFHAATAYDILRARGVALGKRDYLGKVRTL